MSSKKIGLLKTDSNANGPEGRGYNGSLFLTGTDTGVGKTHIACAIVRERRARGIDCVGLKPICCGDREDALALHRAAEGALTLDEINPLHLAMPAAPLVAARDADSEIDLAGLVESIRSIQRKHAEVVVEGVGGWLVPITRDTMVSDLAAALGLPIVVVVANKLGAINHTLLTVRAIQSQGLECAGIILNQLTSLVDEDFISQTNRAIFEELLDVPILGELGAGESTIRWSAVVSPSATL